MDKKEVKPEADVLFEVSWEVCNKVGGIYTVVKSKVNQMLKLYDDNYFVVGPFFPDKVKGEFMETAYPEYCKEACHKLKEEGIIVHYGKWLVGDRPAALLIDFRQFQEGIDSIKSGLWKEFGIDSLNAGFEFDEPLAWSQAAARVVAKFRELFSGKRVVAHLHEWLSGSAALFFKSKGLDIPSVFTIHATVLGRAMANAGMEMYKRDEKGKLLCECIDIEKTSRELDVKSKHQLEKACAHNADIFTTVSDVTSIEAEHMLGKRPDVVLPNGVSIEDFPSRDECSVQHVLFRDKIFRFLTYYFFPYYNIDFNHTHLYCLASRYEMKDKGIDVFIKSLGKLNRKLKELDSKETIVAFLWVPTGIRGVKSELVENRTFFADIEDSLKDKKEHIFNRIVQASASDKKFCEEDILGRELMDEIYPKMIRFKKSEDRPPVCTHELEDLNDPIMKMLAEEGLDNSKQNNVKVIFYPIYLTGADGLLNLNYYEALQGSHFGIFPSFYEPYGYTPLECASLCVVSLTSDLSGFGQLMLKLKEKEGPEGIYVLRRMDRGTEEIIEDLTSLLMEYPSMPKKQRIANKFEARNLAEKADWKILINNYIGSHNKALEKRD